MTPAPSPEALDRKTQLEIQKLEAEVQKAQTDRQKAELEILELKRWYRRPAVLQSIAAIVVAVVVAIIGTANGWFSARLDSLKLEQEKVQRDIDDLNKGRSTLNAQIAILQAERDQFQGHFSDAGTEADRLAKAVSSLQTKAAEADRYKQDLRNLQQELAKVSDQAKAAANRIPETNLAQIRRLWPHGLRAAPSAAPRPLFSARSGRQQNVSYLPRDVCADSSLNKLVLGLFFCGRGGTARGSA